jgi:hypothetical protein
MVPMTSLVLPIVLAAVLVFVASSIIHMVLGYHAGDMRKLPREDDALDALRRLNIPPGDYAAPRPDSMAGMNKPEFIEKMKRGPIVLMTIAAGGGANMGASLAKWFIYTVVVGVFVAYVTGRVFAPGVGYLQVFRLAGTAAFMAYALALPQHAIWYRRSWRTTLLSMFDGLIYGLLTGGAFGWLWPR